MIVRSLTAALAALATLVVASPALAQKGDRITELPRLKPVVTVVRDVVRIGDLIENAGAVADVAIFRAPDPGSTGTVPADRVLEAARAHNLLLVDALGVRDIEVTRVSRAIGQSDIEQRIVRTFASQFGHGDPARFAISFDREPRTLHVDPQVKGDLQVVRSHYNPRSGRFDVIFSVPDAGNTPPMVRYTGSLIETAPALVLTRPVGRGDTIRASDVVVERRPKNEVTADVVSSVEEIAGMAARSPLRPGPVLRRADLVKPDLIKRDELVTLFYEVPGIALTIRGKALDNGAQGDLINVLNIQSKRTVQGMVTGPGRVTIVTAAPVTVAAHAEAATQSE